VRCPSGHESRSVKLRGLLGMRESRPAVLRRSRSREAGGRPRSGASSRCAGFRATDAAARRGLRARLLVHAQRRGGTGDRWWPGRASDVAAGVLRRHRRAVRGRVDVMPQGQGQLLPPVWTGGNGFCRSDRSPRGSWLAARRFRGLRRRHASSGRCHPRQPRARDCGLRAKVKGGACAAPWSPGNANLEQPAGWAEHHNQRDAQEYLLRLER
jgi:hypothetical protein